MLRIHSIGKFFLPLIAIAIASCAPEASTRKRSYVDQDFKAEDSTATVKLNSSEAQRLQTLLDEAEPATVSQLGTETTLIDTGLLLSKVIIPLRDIVLNANYLLDPANRYLKSESGRYYIPRLISLFNESLVLVYKARPELIVQTDVLQKYKELLFWDCDNELRGSCEMVKVLRDADSPNMGLIVKMIHDQEVDENQQLRLIRVGFDLKNRRLDAGLRFMLLQRISKSMALENLGQISQRRSKQDADLFANIFQINVNEMNNDNKYIDLVRSLNPWLLSRNIDDAKNPAMSEILRLAGEHLIYEQGTLAPEFRSVIEGLRFKVGPDFEQGVEFISKNIKGDWNKVFSASEGENVNLTGLVGDEKQLYEQIYSSIQSVIDIQLFNGESSKILQTLLNDVNFKYDEYFFLAHQLYYGHYNIEDATSFWNYTSKNEVQLMVAIMNLIKIQIVNNIVLTNTSMKNFYNRKENSKLIELLRESDKEGSKIRKVWSKTIIRSKAVKSFINRVVDPRVPENSQIFNAINSGVDALTKNIKFLVTYPNMFPLVHVMASQEMKDSVRTWFGEFTIDSSTVINMFFAGRFSPWFNFGNDGDPLDATEIIYTYYYALITQIFETYSIDGQVSSATNSLIRFSHKDFFEVVVKKMLLENEIEMDEERRSLSQKIEQYKNNAQALQAICREETRLQSSEAQELAKLIEQPGFSWEADFIKVLKPRRQLRNQIAFTDLIQAVYDPTTKREGKAGQYIGHIYSDNHRKLFESMRTSFQQKNVLSNTLIDVYKLVYPTEDVELDEVFSKQFAEYKRLKTEFIKLYLGAERQIRGCEWSFAKRDGDIRHALLFREAQFLSDFFEEIWTVLSPLTDEERASLPESVQLQLEEIRKKHLSYTQNSAYPSEYSSRYGYTTVSGTRVTSFRMDMAARLVSYLNEVFPNQYTITMPPDFKTVDIYRESEPEMIYFNWNESDKEVARLAFVRGGLRAFANKFTWAKSFPVTAEIVNKGEILVNIYKLNELSLNSDINCSAESGIESSVREANCIEITAEDVIAHFKDYIQFININERDGVILSYLGLEYKYDESSYESVIKRKNEHKLYSYYDLIFRRVFSDGKVNEPESNWYSGILQGYVRSVHKRRGSTFLFGYDSKIEEVFKRNYNQWLEDNFKTTKEFVEAVRADIQKGVMPIDYSYRLGRHFQLGAETNDLSDNKNIQLEPLVSDLIYGKFEGLMDQFNNDTSSYFSSVLRKYKAEIRELVTTPAGE